MEILKDKVCLVTGTSRGIGSAIVRRFAEEGATVYANARSKGSINEYCGNLSSSYHVRVQPVYFDVRDEEASLRAMTDIFRLACK